MRNTLLGSSIALALATLIAAFALPGCSEDPFEPELEGLASFEVVVPDWVRSNTLFPITVRAIGRRGTKPLTDANGTVTLSVPQGTISPTTLSLASGVAAGQVSLLGTMGSLTVTASLGSALGTGTIVTVSPDSIAGSIANDVAEMIPDITFVPRAQDFSQDHPDLAGAHVSYNTILIAFTQGTTIGQANQILDDITGAIVGGLPGKVGVVEGVVIVRLATASHAELVPVLASLKANAQVENVVADVAVRGGRIARPNSVQEPYDWLWESTPAGGNWGIELVRVPQLWNINSAVAKSGQRVPVGVLDYGFPLHRDLDYFPVEAGDADHGAMVSGIIGALFSNERGVDGVSPFADITAEAFDPVVLSNDLRHTVADNIQTLRRFVLANPNIKLVNLTTVYGWCIEGIAGSNAAVRSTAREQGEEFKRALKYIRSSGRDVPLMVCAAGNDSDEGCGVEDAMYASPWNNAALDASNPTPVEPNIIVVEAVELDNAASGGARRAPFSNTGGHISAPGVCIRSTASGTPGMPSDSDCDVDGNYKSDSGTSFAAPHVTGVVAYMLAVEPALTASEIKDLLTTQSVLVAPGGGAAAAKRLDAWASVVDIDRVKASDRVLRMLLDIDDGTPDGNQRLDGSGNKIDFDTNGDGDIDMSDFRRWRDWYLQLQNDPNLDLDGGTHPKKDPNGNTVPGESPSREGTYPQGDFNGDGKVDASTQSYVPGAIDASVTDLAMLQGVFSDPTYDASELPGLLSSGDITVSPEGCLSPLSPNVVANGYSVVSMVMPSGSMTPTKTVVHSRFQPVEVLTMPLGSYDFKVEVRDGATVVEKDSMTADITLGGDVYWSAGASTTGCVDSVDVREIVQIPILGSPGNHGLSNLGDFDGDMVVDLARIGKSARYQGQRSIYLMYLNTDGTLKDEKIIEAVDLGYHPDGEAPFKTVAGLGDVDKDGVTDLAVGLFDQFETLGAVWILLMNGDGTVKTAEKISGAQLGCASCSQGGGTNWIAPLGDLDGDGVVDLSVAWGTDAGADQLVTLFLNATGKLKSAGQWGPLAVRDNPVASLGDINGDGNADLGYSWSFFFSTLNTTFLNDDGTEKAGKEVFSWPGTETILSLGSAGDYDDDGVNDVIVTTLSPLGTGSNVWVVLLNADGTLKRWLIVNHPGEFIWGATFLGDLDGDSTTDIALLDQVPSGDDSLFILFVKP